MSFERRPNCPACGASSADTLLRLPYSERALAQFMRRYYHAAKDIHARLDQAIYQIERCAECQLVFQRYVASGELLSVVYDDWLTGIYYPDTPEYLAQVAAPAATRDGHELLAVARTLAVDVSRLRVLDYGMGWGLWARIAKELGAESFGHELSETRLEHARQHGVRTVAPESFAEVQADFVNADQIIEHVGDPLGTLGQISRALKPTGILKISVPRAPDICRRLRVLDWDAPRGARNSLHPVQPIEHVNCFDWRSLEALCRRAGFRRIPIALDAYAAFLRVPGGVPRAPRALAKAFARPVYHRLSRTKLYAWFVKDSRMNGHASP